MAVEKPPCPPEQALTAYAAYSAKGRRFIAAPGHYRTTGVLGYARMTPDRTRAAEWAARATDDGLGADWAVVPVITQLPRDKDDSK